MEISNTKFDETIVLENSAMEIIAVSKANIKAIIIPDLFSVKKDIKRILFKEFDNLKLVKEFLYKNNNNL